MRFLVAALAWLAFAGCGGLDETAVPASPAAQTPELEGLPPPIATHLEEVAALPAEEFIWALLWARGGEALRLAQDAVEERYFYPVEVNVPPPELPPAPCPSCR